MIFSTLIALFAAIVAGQDSQAKSPVAVETERCGGGCGAGKPACLNQVVHFQNNQDINVDALEYYNFETSFPYLNFEGDYGWTAGEGYTDGLFQFQTGAPVFLTRNEPLVLEDHEVTYISAQIEYVSYDDPEQIESPLGSGGDPFYAAGFFLAYDFIDTGLEYGYAITNSTVYAIYGRSNITQTPNNNYKAFSYLVPIQPLKSNSNYSLIMNKEDGSVSWMIDGSIRMVIPVSGKLIDERFMINNEGGIFTHAAFPDSVTISIGGDRLYTGSPHTACQDAIFQYCDRSQNIFHADKCECVYEPVQIDGFSIRGEMLLNMFSVVTVIPMKPACSC